MFRLQTQYHALWSVGLHFSLNLTFDVMHTEGCCLLGRWEGVIIVIDCRNRLLHMHMLNLLKHQSQCRAERGGFLWSYINLYWGNFYFWFWICLLFQVKHFSIAFGNRADKAEASELMNCCVLTDLLENGDIFSRNWSSWTLKENEPFWQGFVKALDGKSSVYEAERASRNVVTVQLVELGENNMSNTFYLPRAEHG